MADMPQGAPVPAGAEPPAGGGGDKIVQDITMAGEVIAKLAASLSNKMPELGERMNGVLQEYQSIVQEVMQGGSGGPQPAQGQMPVEAGPNGVPVR